MIERIGKEIRDWIGSNVTGAEVVLGLSDDNAPSAQVGLYLIDLSRGHCARVGKLPPLKINLRYLVTVRAPQPEEAHRILGELIFAALQKPEKVAPEFEVVIEPLPVEAWAVLGVAPQPSFFLQAPLRHERQEPKVPMVREPVVLQPSPMRPLSGVVYGPGGMPIMGARIELLSTGVTTRTDDKGRFRFGGAPANAQLKLLVQAKGLQQEIDFSGTDAAKGDEPLEIRLHIPED
ncbi:MAG TPA: carboxypeptidase regulatory-like domain-containing protein [Blastocatellia bacterium]|nr:carboxypeptidase regulatory-like domain-containing protein [Blastocatellia bacterium]